MLTIRERLATPAPFDVVGLGEASFDEMWVLSEAIRSGSKLAATRREKMGGGQVATALVACRRLGLSAAFIGKLGNDTAGRSILDGLEAEGVDVSAVRLVPGVRSRRALVLVDGKGERTVAGLADPKTVLLPEELPPGTVTAGRVLHVDATHLDAAVAAARAARAAGRVVTCDLDRAVPGIEALLREVDVCITTRDVPEQLAGERHVDHGLRALKSFGPQIVCVTLGSDGAAGLAEKWEFHVPAMRPPGPILDTTACGDTFRAGFIAALLEGRDLHGCLRFAAAAAALKTRDLGRRGCPMRREVEELLETV